MKKFLLLTIACLAVFSAKAWTVNYTNPEGWTRVCAYTYGDGESLGNWPGTDMTQNGDVWTVEGEGNPTNIIFNNGDSGDANQTADLVFEAGKTYDNPSKAAKTDGPAWTVYYTNPSNWEKVCAYTYGGDGEVLGSWPGAEMTKENDVWSVTGHGNPTNIIFDNGDSGDGNQTADLVFEAGKTYTDPAKGGVMTPGGEGDWSVYYTNPSNWEKVYAYAYGGTVEYPLGTWPGTPMVYENDLWTVKGSGDPTNIIFNNGEGGDDNQTADLVFEAGATYNDPAKGNSTEQNPPSDQPIETPAQLYMIGGPFGWSTDYGFEMELVAEGVFYASEITMMDSPSYFAFTAELGSWDIIKANRVAPSSKDAPFNPEGENPFVWGADNSWQIEEGTYDFYVDFNTKMVTTSMPSAVKTIGAENGEEVIYNLQGVKVNKNNMTPGIYIVNGKKVVVK